MASCTRKLKIRRKLSRTGAGKVRKNRVAREGSTAPSLPLNMPNSQERAVRSSAKV